VPNRLGLAAVFLLIAAAAGCTNLAPRAAAPSPRASGHASASTLPAGPATFPGPDGVEARWVIQENRKAGTTAWKIHGRAAGVSGFAGQVYARPGQKVTLYVSTAGPWFRAQAFRMGYYRGKGARLIWMSAQVEGKNQGSCPPGVYPVCNRARVVSYDRPYAAEQGAGNFLALEFPLVKWAEQHALDVTYATDLTVQENPGYLLRHKVLLSLGHDECWSLAERQAAVTAYDHGANIVFFAASPVLRHVRTQPSPFGPDRELVDYRDSAADPLDGKGNPRQVTGNEWANPPSSWPEYDFVGDTYAGFLEPGLHVGFRVADASG
jgi:hypothetical protein